jgi:hypothetical protein
VKTLELSAVLEQLQKIHSLLQVQALEMSAVRLELDIQRERISAVQAQLDVLPAIRRGREAMRPSTPSSRPARNGNGAASKPAAMREGTGR